MPSSPSVMSSTAGRSSFSKHSAARIKFLSASGFVARVSSERFASSNISFRFGVISDRPVRSRW